MNVQSRIEPAVLEFAKEQVEKGSPEFHVETLRTFVYNRTTVAPASPDRILRALRQQHRVEYKVVNRAKSLYRITSVSETIQDETITTTSEPVAEPVTEPVSPKLCLICGTTYCAYGPYESVKPVAETPVETPVVEPTAVSVSPELCLICGRTAEFCDSFVAPLPIPVPPSDNEIGRKLIADLVAFVNKDTLASEAVWDIVTALRGPDNGNHNMKELTTSRLRYAAGFRESPDSWTARFVVSKNPLLEIAPEEIPNGHFRNHYRDAVKGLKTLGII